MLRNSADVAESDIRAITKRVDVDKDGRISFTEFKNLLSLPLPVKESKVDFSLSLNKSTLNESRSVRYESPLRSTSPRGRYYSPNRVHTPVRSPMRYTSPLRTKTNLSMSIDRSLNKSQRYTSPLRTTMNMNRSQDMSRTTGNISNISSFSKTYTYQTTEEETFVSYIKNIIDIENEIEKSKSDLSLRTDFNMEDAFRLFELDSRGFLTELDIKYGLNSLDVYPTSEEIHLLVKRYDLNNEGVLR